MATTTTTTALTLADRAAAAEAIVALEAKDEASGGEFADDLHEARCGFDFPRLAADLRATVRATLLPLPLGRTVATQAAATVGSAIIYAMLDCHRAGDWGILPGEDREANEVALREGLRIVSAYSIDPKKPHEGDNRIWIITEADRSMTTIMFPDEY